MPFHDLLNSFPVVGHVKGVVHHLCGDEKAGNKALKEATRSTVVMGAGAAGMAGGPGLAAALGAYAGCVWDTTESIVTGKPTGVALASINIVETVEKGRVPVGGVVQLACCVGSDVVGGLAGRTIQKAFAKEMPKSAPASFVSRPEVLLAGGSSVVSNSLRDLVSKLVCNEVLRVAYDYAALRTMVNNMLERPEQLGEYTWGEIAALFIINGLTVFGHLIDPQQADILNNILETLREHGILVQCLRTMANAMNADLCAGLTVHHFVAVARELLIAYLNEQNQNDDHMA